MENEIVKKLDNIEKSLNEILKIINDKIENERQNQKINQKNLEDAIKTRFNYRRG